MRSFYCCRSTSLKKDNPFSAVRNCMFNTVATTARIWETVCFFRNLKATHAEDSLVMLQNVRPIVLSSQSGQLTRPTYLRDLNFQTVRSQGNVERQNNNNLNIILSPNKKINYSKLIPKLFRWQNKFLAINLSVEWSETSQNFPAHSQTYYTQHILLAQAVNLCPQLNTILFRLFSHLQSVPLAYPHVPEFRLCIAIMLNADCVPVTFKPVCEKKVVYHFCWTHGDKVYT